MSDGSTLQSLLSDDGIVVASGVHDSLSAKVVDHVRFDLMAMTGNGTSLSKIGRPDVDVLKSNHLRAKYRTK